MSVTLIVFITALVLIIVIAIGLVMKFPYIFFKRHSKTYDKIIKDFLSGRYFCFLRSSNSMVLDIEAKKKIKVAPDFCLKMYNWNKDSWTTFNNVRPSLRLILKFHKLRKEYIKRAEESNKRMSLCR